MNAASPNTTGSQTGKMTIPNVNVAELAKMGEKSVAEMVKTQNETLDALTQMNQRWFSRATAEANLASELGTKLAGARSLPEAAEAYQEWMTKRMKMLTEDSQQFIADSQKLMQSTARLFSIRWPREST